MKSSESRQLKFVFADSPDTPPSTGASSRGPQTYLPGQEYLQHQVEINLTNETDTRATDSGQLLERVEWLPNLARALLKVASNKGAPGVDGESVEAAVEHAPQLLADLHQALIDGTYIPGDIRRVWISVDTSRVFRSDCARPMVGTQSQVKWPPLFGPRERLL